MSVLILGGLLILAAVLQTTLLPSLSGGASTVDFVLVLTAVAGRRHGPAGGALAGLAGGLLVGTSFGSMALPFALAYTATGAVAGWLFEDPQLTRFPGLIAVGAALPALFLSLEAVTLLSLGLPFRREPLEALSLILWNALLVVPLVMAAHPPERRGTAEDTLRRAPQMREALRRRKR